MLCSKVIIKLINLLRCGLVFSFLFSFFYLPGGPTDRLAAALMCILTEALRCCQITHKSVYAALQDEISPLQ